MTPEQIYQEICKRECEWCAKGHRPTVDEGRVHKVYSMESSAPLWQRDESVKGMSQYFPCTAPKMSTVISRQAAQLETQANIARDLAISECNLKGVTGTLENIAAVLNCGVRGITEQIDHLVDQRNEYRLKVETQAAEIAELRKDTGRLEHIFKKLFVVRSVGPRTTRIFESRSDIDAAMKEKP